MPDKILTSFRLDKNEHDLIEYVKLKTGFTATEMWRRLLIAYAAGVDIPGMPPLNRPHATAKTLMKQYEQ